MKDSHIYSRMSNPTVIKTYMNMLKTLEYVQAKELFDNITNQAHDHPKYQIIYDTYMERFYANQEK